MESGFALRSEPTRQASQKRCESRGDLLAAIRKGRSPRFSFLVYTCARLILVSHGCVDNHSIISRVAIQSMDRKRVLVWVLLPASSVGLSVHVCVCLSGGLWKNG